MIKIPNSLITQKAIKIFINEIYSKGPKQNYDTTKAEVYHVNDIWSLEILDLRDYGPENNTNYRYVLLVIDNFSKFGWTAPLKSKNVRRIRNSFENILFNSIRKPNLFATDRRKEFFNNVFQKFLTINNINIILEIHT